MKSTNHSSTGNRNTKAQNGVGTKASPKPSKWGPEPSLPPDIRTTSREYKNPVDYQHPYDSMARFADFLALHYDANRTRHAYYRQLRLLHEHFACDPTTITEAQLRDYFLFVKLKKRWQPKTIRQALAAAKMYFVQLLGQSEWAVFSQIRTKDHKTLPAVLTRQQVRDLLAHIRLRRYRTPLKLIYCCGLRLSECLGLTIHDIKGKENKLLIRQGKGHRDLRCGCNLKWEENHFNGLPERLCSLVTWILQRRLERRMLLSIHGVFSHSAHIGKSIDKLDQDPPLVPL